MTYRKLFFLFLPIFLIFQSCGDDDDKGEIVAPPTEEPYLISSQKLFDLPKAALQQAAQVDPQYAFFSLIIQHDVTVYKVNYRADYKGQRITASGLVSIPQTAGINYPLLSAHHGTEFKDGGLPSQISILGLATNPQPYPLFASVGYMTVAPDYFGFGSSSNILHPYYNEQYSAEACINLIKAGKELAAQLNVGLSGKLFLAGYSEGGYVTLATMKEIEANPIKDLTLTATGAGAGGYNLVRIMDTLLVQETYPSPNYLGFILHSYDQTLDWARSTSDIFNPPYAARIPSLYNGSKGGSEINNQLNDTINVLLESQFVTNALNRNDQELVNALSDNSVDDWVPKTPLRLYHGTADMVVPPYDTQITFEKFRAAGSTSVEHKPLQGEGHGSAILPFAADIIPWFEGKK